MPLIAKVSTAQTLFLTTSRAFPNAHAALEGSYTPCSPTPGEHRTIRPHTSSYRPPQCDDAATTTPADTAALATAAALRRPPRRLAAEKRCGADRGRRRRGQWLPGDRRTIDGRRRRRRVNPPRRSLFSRLRSSRCLRRSRRRVPPERRGCARAGGGGRRAVPGGRPRRGTRRDAQSLPAGVCGREADVVGPSAWPRCAPSARTDGRGEAKGVRPIIERAT